MPGRRNAVWTCLPWLVIAGGADARAARGLTGLGEASYVAAVTVLPPASGAPTAFVEGLRAAVEAEAALYGAVGRPVVVNIQVDKAHLKNPVKAMLMGDDNIAAGHVVVVDQAGGQTLGSFAVKVDAERHRGMSLAMTLIGAVDPTGYLDIATTVASAGSATVNRSATELALDANFAAETLRQTFGDAKVKAAHATKP